MTALVTGDPASVSALGADLARRAERLRNQHSRLVGEQSRLADEPSRLEDGTGAVADGVVAALATQLRLLSDCATALLASGCALQDYAVDLQSARMLAADAEQFCRQHGLRVDSSYAVTLPPGAYRVDDATAFAHHLPGGQALVDRARAEQHQAVIAVGARVAAPLAVLRGTGRALDATLTSGA